MNYQFSGVDPEMCVIHVRLHLEGARGKLEHFEQLQSFTLSPTQIREWMENFTSGDANLDVGFMFFCMFFPGSMGKWSNLTSIFSQMGGFNHQLVTSKSKRPLGPVVLYLHEWLICLVQFRSIYNRPKDRLGIPCFFEAFSQKCDIRG